MLVCGYIDESFGPSQNIFAFSCILARESKWIDITRKWNLHLVAKNRELKKAGRPLISRYHASDCSSRHGEFEGWSLDERDRFVRGLFTVFRQVSTFTVVYDVQIDELCQVFPRMERDRLEAAYYWLTTFTVLQIGSEIGSGNRCKLFHDQTGGNGRYDPAILHAFNRLMGDPTFSHRSKFTSVASVRWQDCVALQPADLVAFECYKQAEARLSARKSRKSFDALLNLGAFGIRSKTLNKAALERLKELADSADQRMKVPSTIISPS